MSKTEENLKWVKGKITDLEDDYQHYTMVDIDKCRAYFIECDLNNYKAIEKDLERLISYEKVLSDFNRMTYNNGSNSYLYAYFYDSNYKDVLNKLGPLEDIYEESKNE